MALLIRLLLFGLLGASGLGIAAEFNMHEVHSGKLKLNCKMCHVPAAKGSLLVARPDHKPCLVCHGDAFQKKSDPLICAQCHVPGSKELVSKNGRLKDFSHLLHVDKQARLDPKTHARGDCSFCHQSAALPTHDQCATCHAKPGATPHLAADSKPADCRGCHLPERVAATVKLWPNIRFDHGPHAKANCTTCHGSVPQSATLAKLELPGMTACVSCHDNGRSVPAAKRIQNCNVCHTDAVGKIAPATHSANIRPAWHDESFRLRHQDRASAADAKCFACHASVAPEAAPAQRCASCHQAMRPVSHTARWKDDVHGRFAAFDRTSCATCHTADTCTQCHSETPRTHLPLSLFKNGGHARAAMLDQRSCMTCHTFQNTCADCHRRN